MGYLLVVLTAIIVIIKVLVCAGNSRNAEVVAYENKNDGLGNYNFRFETSDGTFREETGRTTNPESNNGILVVTGSYSYLSPDGQKYIVRYVADDQGFRSEIRKSTISTSSILPGPGSPNVRIDDSAVSSLQGGGLG